MKPVGVLRFLGTNCDADLVAALDALKLPNRYVWWADRFNHKDYSGFVLPGGFSYGDYLRAGALSALTPAMEDVTHAAREGFPILGICNGFQILCEAGLLPGALTKNESLQFQDQWVDVTSVGSRSFWSRHINKTLGQNLTMKLPIAHSLGRYYVTEEAVHQLFDHDQVWLTYDKNPNGSLRDIAGVVNEAGNVAALMPHPERAMHSWMGSDCGRHILEALGHGA